jgi:glycosyltransferase involved in cell wall biosynthesis
MKEMNDLRNMRNIAFLGTSLPRECGIATFTQDLIDGFEKLKDFNKPCVIAINNGTTYSYNEQVIIQIEQHNRADYAKAAIAINHTNIELLIIQHEFGIYGGDSGEYLLDLVEKLNIPFMITFHTVLKEPTTKQLYLMSKLAELSVRVVTMSQNTVIDLFSIYGIPSYKIEVIHHGVPAVKTLSREQLKAQYGFNQRQIISTFGFLSPGKGIEYGIEAMQQVVAQHPEALYIIFGKTHPVVKQETGEVYRESLKKIIKERKLENHVLFVDKLLTQEEIIQSLVMSDIYMTPYLGKDQAVSGTLAYGVGYGRVIVSTPYKYAQEMLADGRGLLANFRDADSLAACLLELLNNPSKKLEMEARTLKLGQTMMWDQIATDYATQIRTLIHSNQLSTRSVI